MRAPTKIVILGASYGSLLGMKLLLAGHTVKLVCLPAEAELINAEGFRVRIPVRGQKELVEVDSGKLSGKLSAGGPDSVEPGEHDLVVLAMQEPQYRADALRALLQKVAKARVPCMSIMNMPPLPYLARIPGFDSKAARHCYADPTVWDVFDPTCMTLCSPDPQAFRPPEEKVNVLQVSLPTNFKAARFVSDQHTALLRALAEDIEAARFTTPGGPVALPVKLKVHDSVFVPLAKWSMLLTGNYRCVQEEGMRAIRDAVHTDVVASRAVYEWVGQVCRAHGATDADLVPFDKYAAAAEGLAKPSSAARALAAGAPNIERVDRLVQAAAAQKDMRSDMVDAIVRVVDSWVERNRRKAAVA
ncbi:MAG: hypothetical protein ABI920_17725 [Casimicrobiaceae bacterium]